MNHTDTEKLTFPEFPEPMAETSNRPLDSSRAMDELEPVIRYYLEHYDSPEKRWKTKNPEPFHI
jgi:hypothetical protein